MTYGAGITRIMAMSEQSPFARALRRVVQMTPVQHRPDVRQHLDQLTAIGIDSFDELFRVARSRRASTSQRGTSCWAIGRMRPRGWVRILGRILKTDEDPGVAHQAVNALVHSQSPTARSFVRHALERGKHPVNRATAAWGLGVLRSKRAVSSLIRVALSPTEDPTVRAEAAEALGYIRDRSAVQPLITLLREPDPRVRFNAVFGLGTLADARALPALQSLRNDRAKAGNWGEVREAVAQAEQTIQRMRPRTSDPTERRRN
jgi:hypothetical protein